MRGGYLHNQLLVAPLETAFRAYGARTQTESQVMIDGSDGYIDLIAECGDRAVAVEAELTPRRVAWDVVKASCIRADELWIVVPNRRVAKAVRRSLPESVRRRARPEVFVLTLGAALYRITSCCPLFSGSIPSENNQENKCLRSIELTTAASR